MQGIRVNSVNPSTVASNFHSAGGMKEEEIERYYADDVASHPIGRIGQPADVAALVLFLASNEEAGWITGQNILCDGGLSLPAPTAKMQ